MRFDDRFLDELKSRLRLSEVIGRTVKLRRQGREYVGLSPFTKERTPSFFVNDDKGFFHDFSSGKHGDLIGFLRETQRLTFVEAVETLAAEAGLPLPAPDPQSVVREGRRAELASWLEMAAAWCQAQLRRPIAGPARDYLVRRGLPEADWARFRLGYAPAGRTALKDYLIAKGALPGELVEAGLLVAPDDGGAAYDRFRDRLMFPITDRRSDVISFGGRALDPGAHAKYLNGPDTPLFDKGRVLFGLAAARELLRSVAAPAGEPALIVVEGYMDVIACQRAGVAAVAPMGTALTEGQLEALWRLHPEPTLCFDGDRAGQTAAGRAIDRALPLIGASRSLRFATLSAGEDPDDVMRQEGPAALRARLAKSVPLVEALFAREREAAPLDTPEQRTALKKRLRAAAAAIGDGDLSAAYGQALLSRFDGLFASRPAAKAMVRRGARRGWNVFDPLPGPPTAPAKAAAGRLARALDGAAAALARGAILSPTVVDGHLEELAARGFGDPALAGLAGEIVRLRLLGEHLDSDALRDHLAKRGFSSLLTDIDRAATHAGAPFTPSDVAPAAARSQWSRAFEAVNRLAALEESLAAAKQGLAGASGVSELNDLKTRRDALRRAVKAGLIWGGDSPLDEIA
ncbi:MAG: DNA primase [Caulobacteraceae bacterium]